MLGDMMKKPIWLKKANPNLPWKYKLTTEKGIKIEPYNFNTYIGQDCDEIDKAMNWIDVEMAKEVVKKVRSKYGT